MVNIKDIDLDAISDIHMVPFKRDSYIDFIIKNKKSDILLLGGDIVEGSLYVPENLKGDIEIERVAREYDPFKFYNSILKELKEYYNEIIVVLGNHEFYMYSMSREEIEEKYKESIEDAGCKFLSGSTVNINGVIIGGVSMYNSFDYLKELDKWISPNAYKYFENKLNEVFEYIVDSRYWSNPQQIFENEFKKLNNMEDVDIMLSHVSPLIHNRSIHPQFRNKKQSTLFCFDGSEYLKRKSPPKLWLSGHSHVHGEIDKGEWDNTIFRDISASNLFNIPSKVLITYINIKDNIVTINE